MAVQRQPLLSASRFDPFHVQKLAAFNKTRASMANMASAVQELIGQSSALSDEATIKAGLYQVTQVGAQIVGQVTLRLPRMARL